ncbi:MAG: DUF3810 domain-containing protein [Clostridiales bacterium]|nr:DUF3810 domain-containing protein [Clostridiales bacterium]
MKFERQKRNGYIMPKRYTRMYMADGRRAPQVKRPIGRAVFILAAVACGLLMPLLLMNDLRTDPQIAEWWTTHIEAGWERVMGTLTSWLPFSVMEFFIVCLIGLGIFFYVRLIINLGRARFKRILTGALSVCVGVIYLLNLYMVSMAFAYYRAEMPIPQSQTKYDAESVKPVIEYFLSDYNKLSETLPRDKNGCVECPYTFPELAERIKVEYAKLTDPYFNQYTPTAKPIVNSWFMSQMLITGMTFLPTGEANVNNAAPPTTRTITLAHELAHAKGVFREGDANLLARYVLISSDDDYLRYCGYYYAFDNLLEAFILTEDMQSYRSFSARISGKVRTERWYASDYWNSQLDLIGQIAEFFNNWYLESNGATNGTGSYENGNQSTVVTPSDPITGEPVRDPVTQKPVRIIHYSQVQKMFFAVYEQRTEG